MRELLKTESPESRMTDLQREMASFEIDRYGSVLQHLIIKSASTYDDLWLGQSQQMQATWLLKQFIHKDISETYVPHIVKSLCDVGLIDAVQKYVKMLAGDSFGLLFASIYTTANSMSPIEWIDDYSKMCTDLIQGVLASPEGMGGPYFDVGEALLSTDTSMLASSFSKHSKPKMQFLLMCAFQMAQNPRQVNQKMQKQREMLVAVFILKLLQIDSGNLLNWNEQELDHLYSSLFYCTSD